MQEEQVLIDSLSPWVDPTPNDFQGVKGRYGMSWSFPFERETFQNVLQSVKDTLEQECKDIEKPIINFTVTTSNDQMTLTCTLKKN